MKNLKIGLGLGTLAIAMVMAFSTTQKATASILRETQDPNSPVVEWSDCNAPSPQHCAYEFSDDNQLMGSYEATKL